MKDSAARLYLARLSPGGRKGAYYALRVAARLMTDDPDIDAFQWGSLDRRKTVALIARMQEMKYSPNTISHTLSVLKQVAKEAVELQEMPPEVGNSIASVRRSRGSRVPPGRALSKQEVRLVVDRALGEQTLKGARDACIVSIGAGCGLRCDELRNLTTDDVSDTLRVIGKGNKEANQPIPASIRDTLEDYLSELPAGPLFPRWGKNDTPIASPLTNSGIYYVLRMRLNGATPHDLRRTYATWLEQDGYSLSVIQRLMRHANPETTMRYIRNHAAALEAGKSLTF